MVGDRMVNESKDLEEVFKIYLDKRRVPTAVDIFKTICKVARLNPYDEFTLTELKSYRGALAGIPSMRVYRIINDFVDMGIVSAIAVHGDGRIVYRLNINKFETKLKEHINLVRNIYEEKNQSQG
jgi:hypothetical protein